jgi:hypothetical protein
MVNGIYRVYNFRYLNLLLHEQKDLVLLSSQLSDTFYLTSETRISLL